MNKMKEKMNIAYSTVQYCTTLEKSDREYGAMKLVQGWQACNGFQVHPGLIRPENGGGNETDIHVKMFQVVVAKEFETGGAMVHDWKSSILRSSNFSEKSIHCVILFCFNRRSSLRVDVGGGTGNYLVHKRR
jgi:hypothetical protein